MMPTTTPASTTTTEPVPTTTGEADKPGKQINRSLNIDIAIFEKLILILLKQFIARN